MRRAFLALALLALAHALPPKPPAACVPFDPRPDGAATIQQWCRQALNEPPAKFDALFRAAPAADAADGFALRGCTVGCFVGRQASTALLTGAPLGVWTTWTGKCWNDFDAQTGLPGRVGNIATPGAALFSWRRSGLGGQQLAFGDTGLEQASLVDGRPVWTVRNETLALQLLDRAGAVLVKDELREVRAGLMLGKGFLAAAGARPAEAFQMAFLQVCARGGGYAVEPRDRAP